MFNIIRRFIGYDLKSEMARARLFGAVFVSARPSVSPDSPKLVRWKVARGLPPLRVFFRAAQSWRREGEKKGQRMISKDRWSNFVMAIAGGVVGAIVAGSGLPGRLWSVAVANAATHHSVRAVVAEQFILVDRMGAKRAGLG